MSDVIDFFSAFLSCRLFHLQKFKTRLGSGGGDAGLLWAILALNLEN